LKLWISINKLKDQRSLSLTRLPINRMGFAWRESGTTTRCHYTHYAVVSKLLSRWLRTLALVCGLLEETCRFYSMRSRCLSIAVFTKFFCAVVGSQKATVASPFRIFSALYIYIVIDENPGEHSFSWPRTRKNLSPRI